MKFLLVAALAASQFAATPCVAANLIDDRATAGMQRAGFAGARVRLPLGHDQGRPQMGLALTSTQRGGADGALRFSPGVELGVSDRKLQLSLAGMPMTGKAARHRKAGVSTLGWIAIGVGTAVVVTLGVGYLWLEDAIDCDPDEECN